MIAKRERKKVNILGAQISALNKSETFSTVEQFLNSDKQNIIYTPNPEIVLKAQANKDYCDILNSASLLISDGIGLKFAGWVSGVNLERFTGVDLTKMVLNISKENNKKVLILNWEGGLLSEDDIIKMFQEKYTGLEFLVRSINKDGEVDEEMKNFQADVMFVNFGAPYQEKFIYNNLGKLPSVKLACGIGGSFDFLTGKIKRAPKMFKVVGMEWLWRLTKQPKRIGRIFSAVVVFPLKFAKWKFIDRN